MAILKTKGLIKAYGARRVVNSVDIDINGGQIVGLLGPNGAGKTTTFYMIVGLIKPEEGSVLLNDADITNLPMYMRAKNGIGYLPQDTSIFQKLTVEDNIMAVLETLEIPKEERLSRLEVLLDELKIKRLRKNRAYTLSGGERRRLEITRALVTRPSFLLLDEPFSGIDPIAVNEVQEIIRQLKARGLGILVTDHNVRETLSITDHSYIMADGRILISGDANVLLNDPKAREVYLGAKFKM